MSDQAGEERFERMRLAAAANAAKRSRPQLEAALGLRLDESSFASMAETRRIEAKVKERLEQGPVGCTHRVWSSDLASEAFELVRALMEGAQRSDLVLVPLEPWAFEGVRIAEPSNAFNNLGRLVELMPAFGVLDPDAATGIAFLWTVSSPGQGSFGELFSWGDLQGPVAERLKRDLWDSVRDVFEQGVEELNRAVQPDRQKLRVHQQHGANEHFPAYMLVSYSSLEAPGDELLVISVDFHREQDQVRGTADIARGGAVVLAERELLSPTAEQGIPAVREQIESALADFLAENRVLVRTELERA